MDTTESLQLKNLRDYVKTLENQLKSQQKQRQTLIQQLSNNKNMNQNMTLQIEYLVNQLKQLDSIIDEKNLQNQKIKKEMHSLLDYTNQLHLQILRHGQIYNQQENKLTDPNNQSQTKQNLMTRNQNYSSCPKLIFTTKHKPQIKQQIQSDFGSLQQQLQKAKSACIQKDLTITNLQKDIESCSKILANKQKILSQFQQQIQMSMIKKLQLQNQFEKISRKASKLEMDSDNTTHQLSRSNQLVQSLQTSVKQKEKIIKDKERQIQTVKQTLKAQKQILKARLKQQFGQFQQHFEYQLESMSRQIHRIREQLFERDNTIAKLQTIIDQKSRLSIERQSFRSNQEKQLLTDKSIVEANMKQQISRLERKVQNLQSETQTLRVQLSRKQQSLQTNEKQLNQERIRYLNLTNELKKQIQFLQEQRAFSKKQLRNMNVTNESLKSSLQSYKMSNETLKANNQTLKVSIQTLKKSNQSIRSTKQQLMNGQENKYRMKELVLVNEKEALLKECNSLKDQIEQLKQENIMLKKEIQAQDKRHELLIDEVKTKLEITNNEKQDKLKKRHWIEIAKYSKEIDKLRADLEEQKKHFLALKKIKYQNQHNKDKSEQIIHELQSKAEQFDKRCKNYEEQNRSLLVDILVKEKEIQHLSVEKEQMHNQVLFLKNKTEEMEMVLGKKNATIVDLQRVIQQQNTTSINNQQQFSLLKSQLEAEIREKLQTQYNQKKQPEPQSNNFTIVAWQKDERNQPQQQELEQQSIIEQENKIDGAMRKGLQSMEDFLREINEIKEQLRKEQQNKLLLRQQYEKQRQRNLLESQRILLEYERQKGQNQELKTKCNSLEERLQAFEQQYLSSQQSLIDYQLKSAQLAKKCTTLEVLNQSLKRQHSLQIQRLLQIQNTVHNVKAKQPQDLINRTRNQEIQRFRNQVFEVNSYNAQLQKKLQQKEDENLIREELLRQKEILLDHKEQQIAAYQNEMRLIQNQLRYQEDSIMQKNAVIKQTQEQLSQLLQKIRRIESELKQRNLELKEKEEVLHSQTGVLQSLEIQLECKLNEANQREQIIQKQSEQIRQLELQVNSLNFRLSNLTDKEINSENSKNKNDNDNDNDNDNNINLPASFSSLNRRKSQHQGQQEQDKVLQKKVFEHEKEKLIAEIESKEKIIAEYQMSLFRQTSQLESFKKQVHLKDLRIQELRKRIAKENNPNIPQPKSIQQPHPSHPSNHLSFLLPQFSKAVCAQQQLSKTANFKELSPKNTKIQTNQEFVITESSASKKIFRQHKRESSELSNVEQKPGSAPQIQFETSAKIIENHPQENNQTQPKTLKRQKRGGTIKFKNKNREPQTNTQPDEVIQREHSISLRDVNLRDVNLDVNLRDVNLKNDSRNIVLKNLLQNSDHDRSFTHQIRQFKSPSQKDVSNQQFETTNNGAKQYSFNHLLYKQSTNSQSNKKPNGFGQNTNPTVQQMNNKKILFQKSKSEKFLKAILSKDKLQSVGKNFDQNSQNNQRQKTWMDKIERNRRIRKNNRFGFAGETMLNDVEEIVEQTSTQNILTGESHEQRKRYQESLTHAHPSDNPSPSQLDQVTRTRSKLIREVKSIPKICNGKLA